MRLVVNGTVREVPEGSTVVDVLRVLDRPAGRGTAVAVDGEVLPRAAWATTALDDGAHVEILAAMQGG